LRTSSCCNTTPGQSAGDVGRLLQRRRRQGSPLGAIERLLTYNRVRISCTHPRRPTPLPQPPTRTTTSPAVMYSRASTGGFVTVHLSPSRPNPSSLNTQTAPTRKSIEPVSTHPHTLRSKIHQKTRFPHPISMRERVRSRSPTARHKACFFARPKPSLARPPPDLCQAWPEAQASSGGRAPPV
jgi:hypothetical protein